jgi:hypothetical protein
MKDQVRNEYLIELSTSPISAAGEPLGAYGVSAENVGIDDVGNYESLG